MNPVSTPLNGRLKWIVAFISTGVLGLFSWILISIITLDRDSVGYSYNITALSEAAHAQSQLNSSIQTTVSGLQNTTGVLDQRISGNSKELEDERQRTNDALKELKQELNGVDDKLTEILIRLGGVKK